MHGRRGRRGLAGGAALLGTLALLALAPAPRRGGERVVPLGVVDGDGLRVRRAGREEALRLACVDCEESLHTSDRAPRDKPQTVLGERARLWLVARLANVGELTLEAHPDEPRDGFGRLLAHARLPDGRDLGLELVRAGLSPYFTKYGTCPLADRAYARAEREARAARRGIWAPDANRPRTPDAPIARRDYDALRAWWTLRADAIAGYRARAARDPLGTARADRPAELARAADGRTLVFVELVRARQRDGALELTCAGDLLTLEVPAAARPHFADLDLERRHWSGRANHLWLRARPVRDGDGWRAVCREPGDLVEAVLKGS